MGAELPKDWRTTLEYHATAVFASLIHSLTIHARGATYLPDFKSPDEALAYLAKINEQIHSLSGMPTAEEIDFECLEASLCKIFDEGPLTTEEIQRAFGRR